jgi:hypothetical protein
MLAPVHHIGKGAVVQTVKNTLRRFWQMANNPHHTRPEYLDHLKV